MTTSISPAQEIFLRQLGGEQVRFAEYRKVRITKATPQALKRQGLIEYGRHDGSATMGWHLTETGKVWAQQLIRAAAERQEVAR